MTRHLSIALLAAALAACNAPQQSDVPAVATTPKAKCGPGARPETSYQGRVTQADHDSGRAALGFQCNTELVGAYLVPNDAGTVGGFKVERYVDAAGHECAYYDTTLLWPTNIWGTDVGVNVMDMSDPAHPVLAAQLLTPAMQSPHESLNISVKRGILAAVAGNPAAYPGWVDVYDISQDCRAPVLKSSLPVGVLGHESGMAPDGNTFYSASPGSPTLTAIDITDPSTPAPLAVAGIYSHGLTVSDDGNRAYVAEQGPCAFGQPCVTPDVRGLTILDTSQVQARMPNPQMPVIARLSWHPGSIPQNAIPITIHGHPYVVEIDEFGAQSEVGAGRIIDIADEQHPKIVSQLRLEVHQPENFATQANDPGANNSFVGGYAGHYCNVPSGKDPGIVACSMILSGLRIFDIRDPANPREVAYFNAPVRPRLGTVPAPASNWAMSSPAFVPARKEIWYSDGYNGFYVVRVTNGAW
jgi:hypothetical protein